MFCKGASLQLFLCTYILLQSLRGSSKRLLLFKTFKHLYGPLYGRNNFRWVTPLQKLFQTYKGLYKCIDILKSNKPGIANIGIFKISDGDECLFQIPKTCSGLFGSWSSSVATILSDQLFQFRRQKIIILNCAFKERCQPNECSDIFNTIGLRPVLYNFYLNKFHLFGICHNHDKWPMEHLLGLIFKLCLQNLRNTSLNSFKFSSWLSTLMTTSSILY